MWADFSGETVWSRRFRVRLPDLRSSVDASAVGRQNGRVSRLPTPKVDQPADGLRRYRATIAYDGAPFSGFATNPGRVTVAGELNDALSKITGRPIDVACAGRTDAGVHAWGQVISFDARPGLVPRRVQHSLNRMQGPAIAVRGFEVAAADFDARFSAKSRTYRYRILNSDEPNPFLHATSWHLRDLLDVEIMNTAGQDLVGEHDFSSFCRAKLISFGGTEIQADLTRAVHSISWSHDDDNIVQLWITARAFCHQMVRSVAGTLVEIGLGKRPGDSIAATLAARDRNLAGILAPPRGLTLWDVGYD